MKILDYYHRINENKDKKFRDRNFNGKLFNQRLFTNFKSLSFNTEIVLPYDQFFIGLTAEQGEGLQFKISLPLIGCGFFKINSKLISKLCKKLTPDNGYESYGPWETEFRISNWQFSWSPWVPQTIVYGKHSGKPWWMRSRYLDLKDLIFGRMNCVVETNSEPQEVEIPMFEKTYKGTVKFETRIWFRKRLPFWKLERKYTEFETTTGIPFPGKGENSWDCGMDGLYGTSCEGHDVEKCIGTVVESVLRYRKRYGGSHKVDLTPEEPINTSDVHIKSDSNFKEFIKSQKENS